MITNEKWKELVEKWEKIGPVYQIPRRSRDRLKHFCDNCLPLLENRSVLEIGANAGLFGYCVAETGVPKYYAIEPGNKISDKKRNKTDYFKQLYITAKSTTNQNMTAANATVKEFCQGFPNYRFNALVMCYVLYHLSDKEIDLLKEKILPKCDLVIIQNREQKRKTAHNKYKFWKSKRVARFFEKQGYDVELIWGEDRGVKKAFCEIICRREKWSREQAERALIDREKVDSDYPAPKGLAGRKNKPETVLDKQGGIVPKKKSVKKKVTKKVIKKDETNGKNKTDNTGEAPVSGGRSSSDRQGSVDKGN